VQQDQAFFFGGGIDRPAADRPHRCSALHLGQASHVERVALDAGQDRALPLAADVVPEPPARADVARGQTPDPATTLAGRVTCSQLWPFQWVTSGWYESSLSTWLPPTAQASAGASAVTALNWSSKPAVRTLALTRQFGAVAAPPEVVAISGATTAPPMKRARQRDRMFTHNPVPPQHPARLAGRTF
jgi:hypothetical protein